MDKELYNLRKRIEKYGIAFTTPSVKTQNLGKKSKNIIILQNRRLKKSVAINEKKLKELLGTNFL